MRDWKTTSAMGKMISTLKLLLGRVREAGLRLQLKECDFFCKKIIWLGFEVSSKGIQIPTKLKKELLGEAIPRTPAQLTNYLGRLLYFRQFVVCFSHYSARLHEDEERR